MAESIRGLTIEISADASGFNQSMNAIRKDAKSSQKELDALQKSLELEYDPAKFERAQKVAQDAIDTTAQQADILRKRLQFLEESGRADTSDYRRISAELAQTELNGQKLEGQLAKINGIKFDHAGKAVQSLRGELDTLQKSLELKFDSDKFVRAQNVAKEAIKKVTDQAEELRNQLRGLEEYGKVDTEEYRKLQDELQKCDKESEDFKTSIERLNATKLDKLEKSISGIGEGLESTGKKLTPLSLGAAGALTGLGALGIRAVSTADEIATLATQYDMTSDALGRFNYVALQTDTDAETLYKSFVKMRAGIADIATGTTTQASTALQQLGIDLNSFGSSEEQFYAIITALADMGDRTQMVAIANDLFGEKLANNLLPLIYSGSDAIRTYADEYENLGALSGEQVDALAKFDNVLNTLKTQFSNVALQIGSSLLPIMQILAEFVGNEVVPKLQELAEWFSNLSPEMQGTILSILGVIAIAAPLLIVFGKVATGVGTMIRLFKSMKAAQWQAALGFMALIAAAGIAIDLFANWKEMTWIEKLLKGLAMAALVAAAAIAVFHASWSIGLAVGGIAAGVTAAIAAINAAREEVLPESEAFEASDFDASSGTFSEEDFMKKYGALANDDPNVSGEVDPNDFNTEERENLISGTVYDKIGAGSSSGDVYNNDYSTTNTTQNVTVVIENYAAEVDVDALVSEINIKLAEAM